MERYAEPLEGFEVEDRKMWRFFVCGIEWEKNEVVFNASSTRYSVSFEGIGSGRSEFFARKLVFCVGKIKHSARILRV